MCFLTTALNAHNGTRTPNARTPFPMRPKSSADGAQIYDP